MSNLILDEGFKSEKGNLDKITRAKINNIKVYVNTSIKDIKGAKIMLIVISLFLLIGSLFNISYNDTLLTSSNPIEGSIKAIGYFTCALFINKHPKFALIGALTFFIGIQLYNMLDGFVRIFAWAFFKIPVLYILIQGIRAAIKLEQDAVKLADLGVPDHEILKMKQLKEIPLS